VRKSAISIRGIKVRKRWVCHPRRRGHGRPSRSGTPSRLRRGLWRETVHLEQGVILLPRAKGCARPLILSVAAQAVLREALAQHPASAWVRPVSPTSASWVGKVFRQAAGGAGLRDFHSHDLRHHGATMALNAGFTVPIVQELGGRKSQKMMRRYAAITNGTLCRAAEAVSESHVWKDEDDGAEHERTRTLRQYRQ
jgi:integrase